MIRKIYQIVPPFETETASGQPVRVTDYEPDACEPWLGTVLGHDGWEFNRWAADGNRDFSEHYTLRLVSIPEVPPEAREPRPGEVWESRIGKPHLVLEEPINSGVTTMSRKLTTGRVLVSWLPRPWPAGKPHGFESLIEAIRGAET